MKKTYKAKFTIRDNRIEGIWVRNIQAQSKEEAKEIARAMLRPAWGITRVISVEEETEA